MKKKSVGFGKQPAAMVSPFRIALFVAFGVAVMAIGYKVLTQSTDMRSRASNDCMGKWKTAGKERVCRNVKNKKGVVREVCSMEMQYYCDNSQAEHGGGTLQAVDGSGESTPTQPPTLQEAP